MYIFKKTIHKNINEDQLNCTSLHPLLHYLMCNCRVIFLFFSTQDQSLGNHGDEDPPPIIYNDQYMLQIL